MEIKIALAGNPNCGKITLFNGLTGANQYVGNWPGVTVEKKEGRLKRDGTLSRHLKEIPRLWKTSGFRRIFRMRSKATSRTARRKWTMTPNPLSQTRDTTTLLT